MKKRTRKILIFSLFVVIFLFIIGIFQEPPQPMEFVKNKTLDNYSTLLFDYEINRYPSSVEIDPIKYVNGSVLIGFVTDPWNINFGVIPGNGSYVKRNIEITNSKGTDSKITLRTYGNITPLVSFSENDFVLKKGEKTSIDIFLYSDNASFGNYSGEIDIIAKKAIYNFLPIS